jgi:hypothetical protein
MLNARIGGVYVGLDGVQLTPLIRHQTREVLVDIIHLQHGSLNVFGLLVASLNL